MSIPKTSRYRKCHQITPWWDEECKAAVEERKRTKNLLWSHPTPLNLIRYKRFVAIAKHIALKNKKESWNKFTESLGSTTPSSKVWRAIKSIWGKKGSINLPIGNQSTSNYEIAMLFLEHFTHDSFSAEVHVGDGEVTGEVESAVSGVYKPTCPEISLQELQTSIQTLKNTSPGNDLISNAFLRRSPDYIKNELLSLFNTSFVTGVVPGFQLCGSRESSAPYSSLERTQLKSTPTDLSPCCLA